MAALPAGKKREKVDKFSPLFASSSPWQNGPLPWQRRKALGIKAELLLERGHARFEVRVPRNAHRVRQNRLECIELHRLSEFFDHGCFLDPRRSLVPTSAFGGQTLGSTMAGPPSLEEAVGCLAQQFAELVPQRLCQVGVDLRGSQARMPEQDLDDADVHAALEHVRGEAVTQRVRPEIGVKAAGVARLDRTRPVRLESGRWVSGRRLGKSHRRLWWVFQTSRSISRIDSVSGRMRSLFPLPTTRSTICFESTAEMGSVTASVMRKP